MVKKQALSGQQLVIRYVPLSTVQRWDRNPKLHDIGTLVKSIEKHGFRDAPIYDETLAGIVAGNGRAEALAWMRNYQLPPPAGIAIDEDGEWYLPIQFGLNAPNVQAAEAFGVDHNALTMLGGDLTLFEMAKVWDEGGFETLLTELAELEELPVSIDPEDVDALLRVEFMDELMPMGDINEERSHGGYNFRVYVGSRDFLMDALKEVRALLDEHDEWDAKIV